MQTRDWEGEDGVKRYRTEIVADNMIMLDRKGATNSEEAGSPADDASKDDSGSSFQAPRQQRSVKVATEEAAPKEEEISIDDLPF